MLGIFKKKPRTVVVGLDGVPYGLITSLASMGVMPAMAKLIDQGRIAPMASAIPEISSIAWSTVITGKNPGEHGILGFMELAPGSYALSFPNFKALRTDTFWDRVPDKTCAVLNVPSTYPARKMNGVLIAGFVALDLADATWPKDLVPALEKRDYRLDVNARLGHKDMLAFLADLDYTLDARIETYRWLWKKEAWDLFMAVFTGTDRLMHFLFEAWSDEGHEHREAFLAHFRKIDGFLAWLVGEMGKDDTLLMLSDHGFERLEHEVYVNALLRQWGFLTLDKEPPDGYENIAKGTRAFALDPARLYVHVEGKYPRGSVPAGERAKVVSELKEAFGALEIEGRKPVKAMFEASEVYEGPEVSRAADLILLSEPGFDLKATLRETDSHGRRVFTGKHTQPDAFLFLKPGPGAGASMPEKPSVQDVAGILLQSLGS